MPLSDSSSVDVVAKRPNSDDYDLIIFDDGSIVDESSRYDALVKKLAAYLTFIISGQLHAAYPDTVGKSVACSVICERPPSPQMRKISSVRHGDVQLEVWMGAKKDYLEGLHRSV